MPIAIHRTIPLTPSALSAAQRWTTRSVMALGLACATLLAMPAQADNTKFAQTKFGTLSVAEDNLLYFNGKLVTPGVMGNVFLEFVQTFDVGNKAYVIVANHGGTACSVLYNIITLDKNKATSSPTLGTCDEIGTVQLKNQALHVQVDAQDYVYAEGVLTANGSVERDVISSKPFSVQAVINDPDGYTNVRQAANGKSPIVARVNKGDTFSTHQQAGDWWQVQTQNGTGYMHKSRIVVLRTF